MTGDQNRPLSDAERLLAAWLLKHGGPEAESFLSQLEMAEVTPWTCPCGCASINFQIKGRDEAPPGVRVLSDYSFGIGPELKSVFIYESGGILSGMEVVSYGGDAPRQLPTPDELRPKDAE